MPLQVQLVAADRPVWEGEASSVTARTTEGELGILPGHTPLLGVLVSGDVSITSGEGRRTVRIDSGFLSVHDDHVTLVAEHVDEAAASHGR
ncbi:F0F1 ATP synthase subunit epsilon [Arsenicicoccus sp. oral taxon 190]|uniref:F0F1 ATP synthase subunit epsilon n=1 Tax=Arsenicicoccus sp. oral taxon 190 TaxID=1658671 RepID=UPI00067A04F0|nr:F0F1 ATP synthase subunit epsilon [Arsenicicoccus sp. oral taxon 190]AKT52362.1 ATP synthase F0F1 subunit epsilon [Arsenicicoccus sp. oral taxon 190]